jgi:hypothetical protein
MSEQKQKRHQAGKAALYTRLENSWCRLSLL